MERLQKVAAADSVRVAALQQDLAAANAAVADFSAKAARAEEKAVQLLARLEVAEVHHCWWPPYPPPGVFCHSQHIVLT